MKKILLLLTEAFPLTKNAEAFLEPEIEIAASYFNEIYIFPTARRKKNNNIRDITIHNVYISPVQRNSLFVECIKSIPFIFKHKGFWQDVRMFFINGLFCSISAWKKLIYTLLTEKMIIRHFQNTFFDLDKNAVVVVYSYWMFGEAGGAIAIKKLLENENSFAIARAHGSDVVGYPTLKSYSPLKKYHMDNLDMIYPVSKKGKTILAGQYWKYGANSNAILEKICPIHLGIEDIGGSAIHPATNTDEFIILSCSSVIPVKRVNLIVEALSLIRGKKIRWIHLGGGDLLDDIKKKCEESLGVNILVEFRGALSRNAVIEFYKTADIHLFINVSSSEGIPVSIMEAFSFGIPAIATNVGGTSELCLDGINGYLLPRNFKPEELCERITEFLNLVEANYERYLQFRSAARKTVLKEFSLFNYKKFYESILVKVYGDYDAGYIKKTKRQQ